MSEPADVFRMTTAAVELIVDTATDSLVETPCPEWNYAQLLGHLVGGDRVFLKILTAQSTGQPLPDRPARPRMAPDPDQPPPSSEDYRRWSGQLADRLDDPQVEAGSYDMPVGRLSGPQVVLLRSVEHLLHGWDLAKSAGDSTATLEPVAEALMEPAQQLLAAVGDQTLGERRPFAQPVEVGADADLLTRFVAAFGRDPGWLPDPVAGYGRVKERFAAYEDVELPNGSRRGFGADGLRVGGSVFAATFRDRMMLKLPEHEVAELIGAGLGLPFSKPGQRPYREWVLVPLDGAAGRRAEDAYAFVRGTS